MDTVEGKHILVGEPRLRQLCQWVRVGQRELIRAWQWLTLQADIIFLVGCYFQDLLGTLRFQQNKGKRVHVLESSS